jgi:predicted acylesterase/phospholipase RssA
MLALVLGGGAKGYTHIAVIRCLEELHIKPQFIVSASMGTLIAGFCPRSPDSILETSRDDYRV